MSQLDPVQIAALNFAKDKSGVGWFLEQGLGKTLCALAEFSRYFHEGLVDRMIVVCPNSFKNGWADEIEKHGFDLDVHIFQSSKKESAGVFVNMKHRKPPVLIINYEALRMSNVIKAVVMWAMRGRAYLAIDESIQIKTHNSHQTKAVLRLTNACRYIRLLTGRPQSQGPQDLFPQLRAIGLFAGYNFFSFRGIYCEMGGWQNKEVVGVKNPEMLAAQMTPVVFQAKKKDWLPGLPRKDFTIRDYAMSTEQLAQYSQMERQFLLELERGDYVTVEVAIAKYAKLAQIMTGFIYDELGYVRELVKPSENPRLQLLKQMLEEEVEGKACVVYKHRAVFDILVNALNAYYPAWIKGMMRPEEIDKEKTRFNTDPYCRVILLQCDAAKYGHTLLGGPGEDDLCRTMIFFENSYNADTRGQIEDRIHRRGQTGERVLYIDLSGSDLDRRIVKALQHKDRLYQSVFRNLREAAPAA